MEVLRSEADFSHPDLSRERRWLALFLLVQLADEHGRMGTAYRRVLRRAARNPQHWAHGRSLGSVRAEVTRWFGLSARPDSPPSWERVADLVHDAVHHRRAPNVLKTARYLHCLVTGVVDEDAERHRPHWLDPAVDVVTTSVIGGPVWARKHGLPEPPQLKPTRPKPARPKPAQPKPRTPRTAQLKAPDALLIELPLPDVSAPENGTPENAADGVDGERSAYELLWSVVRVHREAELRIAELEHRVRELGEENARLSGDVAGWSGDHQPRIPGQRRTRPARPVADRHLALEDPSQAFTYKLSPELPRPR